MTEIEPGTGRESRFVYAVSHQSPEEIRSRFYSLLEELKPEHNSVVVINSEFLSALCYELNFEQSIYLLREILPMLIETSVEEMWRELIILVTFGEPSFSIKPTESHVYWVSLPIEASFRELMDALENIHELNERKKDQSRIEPFWAPIMDMVAPMGKKPLPWKNDLIQLYNILRTKSPHFKFGEDDSYQVQDNE